jgi:hypothetical protein
LFVRYAPLRKAGKGGREEGRRRERERGKEGEKMGERARNL